MYNNQNQEKSLILNNYLKFESYNMIKDNLCNRCMRGLENVIHDVCDHKKGKEIWWDLIPPTIYDTFFYVDFYGGSNLNLLSNIGSGDNSDWQILFTLQYGRFIRAKAMSLDLARNS